jgi:hypothetical protein
MTKTELKTGMKVVYRDGRIRMVLKDTPFGDGLVDERGRIWNPLNFYTDDLMDNTGNNLLDIMEVHVRDNKFHQAETFDLSTHVRVWKRVEPRRMTMDELREALGFDFVIAE